MFWAGFEQAGASFNLFAERYTDRDVRRLGSCLPAWFQSVNPLFIVVFAPVFAALWVHLGRRILEPSAPAKFGIGLLLLGAGFVDHVHGGREYVSAGQKVSRRPG